MDLTLPRKLRARDHRHQTDMVLPWRVVTGVDTCAIDTREQLHFCNWMTAGDALELHVCQSASRLTWKHSSYSTASVPHRIKDTASYRPAQHSKAQHSTAQHSILRSAQHVTSISTHAGSASDRHKLIAHNMMVRGTVITAHDSACCVTQNKYAQHSCHAARTRTDLWQRVAEAMNSRRLPLRG